MKHARTADEFFAGADRWIDELQTLRAILLATPLNEEVKWGGPCYTYKGKTLWELAHSNRTLVSGFTRARF